MEINFRTSKIRGYGMAWLFNCLEGSEVFWRFFKARKKCKNSLKTYVLTGFHALCAELYQEHFSRSSLSNVHKKY